ncbi:hypothetical protein VTK56DRAFT_1776 [Thermocarpiscus australiensis]
MTSLKTGPSTPGLHLLYIPAVCALIAFQGYYSQYLFNTNPDLAPGPLTRRQSLTFNALLLCVWWTYYRACTVDPGRYVFPAASSSSSSSSADPAPDPDPGPTSTSTSHLHNTNKPPRPWRWCKKCAAPKPLRAHHCRHCGRCIPKMDHHCPWTGNCVSMQTFPYFLRFLVYANLALWYLARLLAQHVARGVWAARRLPAYLGPPLGALVGLTVLALVNVVTIVALGVLLYTTVRGWVFNCTMIEEWEVERHEAVLARLDAADEGDAEGDGDGDGRRRRDFDSSFWGDDDAAVRSRLERIEFPYDLGVFANMAQAMGTRNPLRWFLPVFGGGPIISNETPGKGPGWEWEENGFNDLPGLWPPPDPDKIRREREGGWPGAVSKQQQKTPYDELQTPEEVKAAFARRQREDFLRRQRAQAWAQAHQRSGIIAELEEVEELNTNHDSYGKGYERAGIPLWTNSDGDRLWDYGVDEEVEEIVPRSTDDDDVPLSELVRRRKVLTREDDG